MVMYKIDRGVGEGSKNRILGQTHLIYLFALNMHLQY